MTVGDTNGFLIAAYAVMWIGLVGYGIRLHRVYRESRQRFEEASRDGGVK
jgi:hypothetical protein